MQCFPTLRPIIRQEVLGPLYNKLPDIRTVIKCCFVLKRGYGLRDYLEDKFYSVYSK